MSGRIKIGQIGVGHNHAEGKMAGLRMLPEIFEIVGVVESDAEWKRKRGDLKVYEGVRWMTEEELFAAGGLQAVAVETDGAELIPTALRCAAHNLHIHLDKPGGESLENFRALVETCRQRRLALQLAYVYRYNPAIQFALRAVREGWLGEVFEIHAVMSRYDGDNPEYRQWLGQFRGGAMYIFAGYLVDVVYSLLGMPEQVTPFMKRTRDDGLIDNGLAVLEYPKATATVRVSVEEVDGMRHRRLIVCGTLGSVEVCPLETPWDQYATRLQARLTLKHPAGGYEAGTQRIDCGLLGDRYAGQLGEFARIVRGEQKNPFGLDHELAVQEILLRACGVL